jgi:hypothetical protein
VQVYSRSWWNSLENKYNPCRLVQSCNVGALIRVFFFLLRATLGIAVHMELFIGKCCTTSNNKWPWVSLASQVVVSFLEISFGQFCPYWRSGKKENWKKSFLMMKVYLGH